MIDQVAVLIAFLYQSIKMVLSVFLMNFIPTNGTHHPFFSYFTASTVN